MNLKERSTTLVLSGVIAASVALGAAGGTIISSLGAHAQTPAATPSAAAPAPSGGTGATAPANGNAPAVSSGTFKSNEDAAHEATESPEREAQENAGQRPTVR